MSDYIVVGGGSAGCVVASRLSEDSSKTVTLLEAGPEPSTMWIRMPSGVGKLVFPSKYNWGYFTEPVPSLGGRRVYAPRGKTLGGSSAINGMAYVRGQPDDFNSWRQLGNTGWSWEDVLPFYKKSENRPGADGTIRSSGGMLSISDPLVQHPTSRDFIEAAYNAGVPRNKDYNGAQQEGASFLQQTINDGRRHSTYDAFLLEARKRPNLRIETDANVLKIEFEGKRAVAIHYEQRGEKKIIRANKEIVLSSGALNSPKLLMLSGVGPAEELKALGIEVKHDVPGVGKNMQDHTWLNYRALSPAASSVNIHFRGMRKFLNAAWFLLSHRGWMTMTGTQAVAFMRMMPGATQPDVQIMFRPYSWGLDASGNLEVLKEPTISASFVPLRPQSKGEVTLRSANAADAPMIHPNYLETMYDRTLHIEGIKLIRKLFETEPLKSHVIKEIMPGADCRTDDEILDFTRRTVETMHHWSGTCKMGVDKMAVVDPRLRVQGIAGLRVADASIMPLVPSGNTNAPTIMIGEKAADMMKEDARA